MVTSVLESRVEGTILKIMSGIDLTITLLEKFPEIGRGIIRTTEIYEKMRDRPKEARRITSTEADMETLHHPPAGE